MRRHFSNLGLPLLAKELSEMAQRRRTYAVRVAFALLVFSFAGLIFMRGYRLAKGSPMALLGQGATLLYFSYVIEWLGLCLFVPAIVSGALAAEKERNTLQLLFLTRLGPWTILLEKLLSRLVPVATFLLVSLPILCFASLLGGVARSDLEFAVIGLALTALQLAAISLFCSAFSPTAASALVMSYLVVAFVLLFPPLTHLACLLVDPSFPGGPAWQAWLNSTQGITPWFFVTPAALRPFHTSRVPLLVIACTGMIFLVLARLVIVRRAAPQPKYVARRCFQWLDRVFGRVNDRFAGGLVLGRWSADLPDDNPIAWRESHRGNLGRINYLLRVLLVVEVPILLPTAAYVLTTKDRTFSGLDISALLLWLIALLVVLVRAAGLIAAEKARQTLDVLLATPLPLSALVGAKMRGLWRVMAIVSVPILLHAALVGYLLASYGGRRWSYYTWQGFNVSQSARFYVAMVAVNVVILLSLAAQLAFLFGLTARTQARAVTAALGVFIAWSFIPIIVRIFGDARSWVLYLSPISGLLANENANVGWWLRHQTETGRWGFYMLIHCGIYATIVAALAWINQILAARVLLRPAIKRGLPRLTPGL